MLKIFNFDEFVVESESALNLEHLKKNNIPKNKRKGSKC